MKSEQYHWVGELHAIQPFMGVNQFRVAKRDETGKPTYQRPFVQVTEHFFPIDDRDRLDNEIVFDFDGPDKAENYANSDKVEEYLKSKRIPYFKEEHGGRSPHLHIFISYKDEEVKDPHAFRRGIAGYLLKQAGIDEEKSHVDIPILALKTHLIREFKKDIPEHVVCWEPGMRLVHKIFPKPKPIKIRKPAKKKRKPLTFGTKDLNVRLEVIA